MESVSLEEIVALVKELQGKLQELEEQHKQDEERHKRDQEIIAKLTQLLYGKKSEKTKYVEDTEHHQDSLFNEVEATVPVSETATAEQVIKSYVRKRTGKKRSLDECLDASIPVEEVTVDLPDTQCKVCGHELHSVGRELVRRELVYIPAKLLLKKFYRMTYECRHCSTPDHTVMVNAAPPAPVIPHSYVGAGLLAWVLAQKFEYAVPLYRIENMLAQLGFTASRASMANWCAIAALEYLEPLCQRMKEILLSEPAIHADETPVQVLRNADGSKFSKTKAYLWLFAGGRFGRHPQIRLFVYKPTRSGDVPKDFLGEYGGYLHTDDYAGYNKVPYAKRVLCWAHVRRKFVDAAQSTVRGTENQALAREGIEQIGKLFEIERRIEQLSPEERVQVRLQQEKPVLEAFWAWANSAIVRVAPKSRLGIALKYALSNRPGLETYLTNGYCSLSNNLAESSIRPITIGRKNWTFFASTKGARASAIIYSLVETCKAAGTEPQTYFEYLFTHLPQMNWQQADTNTIDDYLPWSTRIKEHCC